MAGGQRGGGRPGGADLRGARQGDDPHRRAGRGAGGQGRQPGRGRAHDPGGRRGADARVEGGVDPARVREALLGGFAQSKILEAHGEKMLEDRFEPGFRSRCTARTWDRAGDRARAGRRASRHRPGGRAVQRADRPGAGGRDHSALVTLYRQLSALARRARPPSAAPRACCCCAALSCPAMSKAVPWSTEVRMIGSPRVTLTAVVDGEQLDRDVALVVVHGDHEVVAAGAGGREDGVGRQRARHVGACGPRPLDRRDEHVAAPARRTGRPRRRGD